MSRNLGPLAGLNPASHRYEPHDEEDGGGDGDGDGENRHSDVFARTTICRWHPESRVQVGEVRLGTYSQNSPSSTEVCVVACRVNMSVACSPLLASKTEPSSPSAPCRIRLSGCRIIAVFLHFV